MDPNIIHRIKYFMSFFAAIPKEKWLTGTYHRGERHCAIGHLLTSGKAGDDRELLDLIGHVPRINDGAIEFRSFGPDPQSRVLKALELRLEKEKQSE